MSHISLSLWRTPAVSRTDESMKWKNEASSSLFQGLSHWVLLSKTKKEEQTACLQRTFSSNLGVKVWNLILGFKFFVFPPSSPYQGVFKHRKYHQASSFRDIYLYFLSLVISSTIPVSLSLSLIHIYMKAYMCVCVHMLSEFMLLYDIFKALYAIVT